MSTVPETPSSPGVSITLSRPAYRLGGTVVGTIQVSSLTDDDVRPRDRLESLSWIVVGQCRLDPRWHNVGNYQKLFDTKPTPYKDLPTDPNTVCFWSTEPIELLELKERQQGRWEDVKPKPIHLAGRKSSLKTHASSVSSFDSNSISLEDQQLAFSFRFDLPSDLPHSVSATSCRYSYSILLRVQYKTTPKRKPHWIRVPLTVLTADNPDPTTTPPPAHTAIPTSQAQAVAHSSGLPCHLTASELHQPAGQLTVHRHGAALFRHVRRNDPRHLQTMRVADPASSKPVCVLTIVGSSRLSPGSRVVLKLDFPRRSASDATGVGNWLPCYQAAACLQGEEVAIYVNGTRKKARSLLLATAHERIDPVCTECACLPLMLPLDTPCCIQTNILEISLSIRVDITVSNAKGDGYRNLQLEIPVKVMHGTMAYEEQEDDDEAETAYLLAIGDDLGGQRIDPRDPHSFPTHDIHDDLKILSLSMADQCGLRPTLPISATTSESS